MKSRAVLVGLFIGGVGLYFSLGLHRIFTLGALQHYVGMFRGWYDQYPVLMLGGYFVLYAIMAAMSIPVASLMGIAGGAVFGLLPATIAVSFASTVGASLAFLSSRHVFRDFVQQKFGDRLGAVNEGIRNDGAWFLFTLRLVPVIPFFAVNLVMGVTSMPLRTYYWISQLGMLPGTVIYVNAGRELGKLQSVESIFTPSLFLSLGMLGIFPLLAREVVRRFKLLRQKRRDAGM